MSVITIDVLGVKVDVDFNYHYDPGVWTYSNGDPGYPASEELNINSIYVGDKDLSNWLEIDALYNEIDFKIMEYINNEDKQD
jgi:hypothetical protein